MAAALPLVDHFAAAHNLAALRELADRLISRPRVTGCSDCGTEFNRLL